MRQGAKVYALAEPEVRRQLLRAFIARLEVDLDRELVILASPWREIKEAATRVRNEQQVQRVRTSRTYMRSPSDADNGARPRSKMNPDQVFGQGSNKDPLVELRGFEP
jgi:hypothetical protein